VPDELPSSGIPEVIELGKLGKLGELGELGELDDLMVLGFSGTPSAYR